VPDDYPIAYRDLAERFGAPASIEDARHTWSYVVKGAERGTVITLIAPGGPSRGDWAAVVPVSEVPDLRRCPVWPVSEARPRLGDVVQAATDYRDPVPQILARHRQPVAAVIAASILEDMPADGERIDPQTLLEEGGKVTLEYDPGESGTMDSRGDVLDPPIPGGFAAIAVDWQGTEIGYGGGDSLAEALLHLRRSPARAGHAGHGPADPWAETSGPYSDEPPF
jgi:hypothetical protein